MLGHRKLTGTDYVDILKRRRWFIIVPMLIAPFIGIAISFLVPPQFVSQTLVLVQEQQVDPTIAKPVVSSTLDSRLASMKEQIQSRSRIQPIVERYNLFAAKGATMDDRVDQTRKAILIKTIVPASGARTGGLPGFYISFTAHDAKTAQLVCQDITSLFVTANLQSRAQHAEGATDFLQSTLDDAKRSLDEQDGKLAAFQREHVGSLPGEETSNMAMLNSLNTQLENANQTLARMIQDRSYQESMLANLLQNQPGAVTTPGSIAQAPQAEQLELQSLLTQEADLKSHYTANHPDVISIGKKIADLRRKMAQSSTQTASGLPVNASAGHSESLPVLQLKAQIRSSEIGIVEKKREQAQIESRIGQYQSRIATGPLVDAQFKDLTRDSESARKFYDELAAKKNSADMAASLERRQQGEQFTVMDMANLPDAPTFPQRWMFAVAGLVVGFVLGLAIVALLEYKDTSLRTEQDVWAFTKLPTLAVIAYSGEIQPYADKPGISGRFKQFFGKKAPAPVEALGKAHG
jgi:polysaccharide chain length determinant protein (PEP-CTERM system associated)